MTKREFFDAVRLRYRWHLKYLPQTCPCSKEYTVDHAMQCPKGGFLLQRHDDVKDTIAKLLDQTCRDVEVEPPLTPLTGERLGNQAKSGDEARLDIAARGFWQRGQRAFFDVRVFSPFAQSHQNQDLLKVFIKAEREKKRAYNQRIIEVEHGSFTPLIFSAYGGYSPETDRFMKELGNKLAEKLDSDISIVTNWLRTKLSFSLIRSAVLCIRGSRTLRRTTLPIDPSNIDITNAMGRIE